MDFDQYKLMLDNSELPSDVIDDLLKSSKPFFDFQIYMTQKTGMNEETLTTFMSTYSAAKLDQLSEEDIRNLDQKSFMESVFKDLCDKYEYDKYDELIKGYEVLSSFM